MLAPASKTIRKNIRFHYFEIVLELDEVWAERACKEYNRLQNYLLKVSQGKKLYGKARELLNRSGNIEECRAIVDRYGAQRLDLSFYILAVNEEKIPNAFRICDDVIEIEPGSIIVDQDLHSFQLSKLRETELPAVKQVGKSKKELLLADDEYLGEFVALIFDKSTGSIMIQSNKHGVSFTQIEQYLTTLRKEIRKSKGILKPLDDYLCCKLRPILDPSIIKTFDQDKVYRSISIKGSDAKLDAFATDDKNIVYGVKDILDKSEGVEFEINISMRGTRKTKSLDKQTILQAIEAFQGVEKEEMRPKVEIGYVDEYNKTDVVNLLAPSLKVVIPFTFNTNRSIGVDAMYQAMKERHLIVRPQIARVMRAAKE